MSSSDSSPNKGFFSDGENEAKYKRYVSINKKLLDDKLSKVNFCTDVPFSMSNGDLFQKFSVEYMKNIIFLAHELNSTAPNAIVHYKPCFNIDYQSNQDKIDAKLNFNYKEINSLIFFPNIEHFLQTI